MSVAAAGLAPVLDALTGPWHLDPGLTAAVGLVGGLYLAGVASLARSSRRSRAGEDGARRRRRWPASRSAAFLGGLALVLVALQSGLDARAEELLSVHMAQHLMLSMAAAPLLVAGAPIPLALRALDGKNRRTLAAAVQSRSARALTHPATTWTLSAAIVLAVHVPAVYQHALASPALHVVEHQALLVAGLLFWLPLIDGNHVSRGLGWLGRTGYLLAAMVPMAALGAWLVYGELRYPFYAQPAGPAAALTDQQLGGALMWVGGKLVMASALLVLGTQALLREERRQAARDAHLAARRRAHAGVGGTRSGVG